MKEKKVLIVGAGDAGRDVLREIRQSPELDYSVLGFIDDDPKKHGKKISGVKVLGGREEIKPLSRKGIDLVIIAIPSAHGQEVSDIVRLCSEVRVAFRIVPRVKEIIEGKAHIRTVREVRVEDLLGRPVVKSDVSELKRFFKEKKVLVTGAAGSIGSELSRQIAAYRPKKLILFDWWENGLFELQQELAKSFDTKAIEFVIGNIQDRKKVGQVVKKFKPNYVFHAAAYKHVPLMEENPEEAVKNNIFGTLNVAKEARANNVERFVLVSTDKAANPISVMGATKLITEGIAQKFNGKTRFMTVRFGNVLESYGSVIPIFKKQIAEGGPVTVTDRRMTRYFMTIPEAAQLILKAASIGNGGELFVLDMGEPVKIKDLAENLIRLSGHVPGRDIKIVYTGKRKGEKINEKLLTAKEALVSTRDEKIYISKSLGIDVEKLPRILRHLKKLSDYGDSKGIKKEFAKFIKGFPKS